MKKVALALSMMALLAAPLARADENSGFQGAIRTGFVLPFGQIYGSGTNSAGLGFGDSVTGFVPIMLEAGFRFNPNVMVGIFGQYAFGIAKNCDGAACSLSDFTAGIQAHYHFAPQEALDPWVGLGVGYEWLPLSVTTGSFSQDATYRGFQFVNLQFGVDFPVTSTFKLAPYASFALGQYSSGSTSGSAGSGSGDVTNTALHEFLTFGFRGSFNL